MLGTRTARPDRLTRWDDRGMVTAEAAVVLPTLLFLLALALLTISTLGAKLQVLDASREAARVAARGDSEADAIRAGTRLAPGGATVRLRDRSHWVEADVSAQVRPFGLLPGFTVTATTLAERENP